MSRTEEIERAFQSVLQRSKDAAKTISDQYSTKLLVASPKERPKLVRKVGEHTLDELGPRKGILSNALPVAYDGEFVTVTTLVQLLASGPLVFTITPKTIQNIEDILDLPMTVIRKLVDWELLIPLSRSNKIEEWKRAALNDDQIEILKKSHANTETLDNVLLTPFPDTIASREETANIALNKLRSVEKYWAAGDHVSDVADGIAFRISILNLVRPGLGDRELKGLLKVETDDQNDEWLRRFQKLWRLEGSPFITTPNGIFVFPENERIEFGIESRISNSEISYSLQNKVFSHLVREPGHSEALTKSQVRDAPGVLRMVDHLIETDYFAKVAEMRECLFQLELEVNKGSYSDPTAHKALAALMEIKEQQEKSIEKDSKSLRSVVKMSAKMGFTSIMKHFNVPEDQITVYGTVVTTTLDPMVDNVVSKVDKNLARKLRPTELERKALSVLTLMDKLTVMRKDALGPYGM